jgi:hypothetical protein
MAGSGKQTFTASTHPLRISRLERLPFELPGDMTWASVEHRLEQLHFRGAVVGPHGSGKTTFLLELAERLKQKGRSVETLFTNLEAGNQLPQSWIEALHRADHDTLILADGYDVLSWRQRRKLRRVLRPHGGLLVTAHSRTRLPTVLKTRVSPALVSRLADTLYAECPEARPSDAVLEKVLRSCGGNVREVFRRLY